MNATLEAPRTAPGARLAPADPVAVPLRVAAGMVRRARRVEVLAVLAFSGALLVPVSKSQARRHLASLRRRGVRRIEVACTFDDGILTLS
jgi:hypothetical protein